MNAKLNRKPVNKIVLELQGNERSSKSTADSVEWCFQQADCNGLDKWLFFYMSLQPIGYYLF